MDQFAPGEVGNISLIYGPTGRATHLTLKIVLLAASETPVYGPSNTGIEEAETGVYDIEQFTYPAVEARYRSYWYDDGTLIPGAVDEFEITNTPLAPPDTPTSGDLCTISDVEVILEDTITGSYAARVQAEITAASGELMRRLERELVPQSTATRRFSVPLDSAGAAPDSAPTVDLSPFEVRSVDTIILHPESAAPITLASGDYSLAPVPSRDGSYLWVEMNPFLSYASDLALNYAHAQVDITGDWGCWSDPPMWARMAVAQWVRARTRISSAPTTYTENPSLGVVASPPVPAYDIPASVWNAFKHLERVM